MVRTAYTLRAHDDDWGQAGTLVRDVMDETERERLVDNVVGHLRAGVSEPVLQRAFDYLRNIVRDLGDRIEKVSGSEQHPSSGPVRPQTYFGEPPASRAPLSRAVITATLRGNQRTRPGRNTGT